MIGFVGLSHLGIVSAIAAASHGFDVIAFDPQDSLTKELAQGRFPILEPGLPELLTEHKARLKFTSETQSLSQCDVVYFSLDVSTDDENSSDLSALRRLIDQTLFHAKPGSTLVILSQVPPGFTHRLIQEKKKEIESQKFGVFYQVETLIFGRAVERALCPERYIIGCADPKEKLSPALAKLLEAPGCPILPMRYESAELAKISINMCLVASIGVANTMAELCEQLGADWSEIVPALKLDKRIGQHSYLAPGLGLAGGNLERDLATVLALSKHHGTDGGIVSSWIANSRHRKDWTWRTLNKLVLAQNPGARIAVLGLTYKEDTLSAKNSPSLSLLSHLQDYSVVVYDPVVSPSDTGIPYRAASSVMEAVQDADAVCIMTPWGEFKKLPPSDLAKRMRGRWLFDPYRVVDIKTARAAGLRHVTLGVASEETQISC